MKLSKSLFAALLFATMFFVQANTVKASHIETRLVQDPVTGLTFVQNVRVADAADFFVGNQFGFTTRDLFFDQRFVGRNEEFVGRRGVVFERRFVRRR